MKIRDISIKYILVAVLLCVLLPLFTFYAIFNYNYNRNIIIDSFHNNIRQSELGIKEVIDITERSQNLSAELLDVEIRKALDEFEKEYMMTGDVSLIDLEKLKAKYQNRLEFYVINREFVIEHTTFATDLGLDFKEAPQLLKFLESVVSGKNTKISKISHSMNLNELSKYGYKPTDDQKYILEVSVVKDVLDDYIIKVDYSGLESKILLNNHLIKHVHMYNIYGEPLAKVAYGLDDTLINIIKTVGQTKTDYEVINERGFAEKKYIFIDSTEGSFEDANKVVEIIYDNSSLNKQLRNLINTTITVFLLGTLVSVFVLFMAVRKLITKPLSNLSKKVDSLDINNMNVEDSYVGQNEIGTLSRTLSEVISSLKNTIVSRDYFETILDSVGDLVIILDTSYRIKQVNNLGLSLINLEASKVIGSKFSDLFNVSLHVIGLLSEEKGVEDIEITLKDEETSLVILASFTVIRNASGKVQGYVCNGKNITNTKETIKLLTESNMRLQREERNLRQEANHDYLTGVYTRRYGIKLIDMMINDGNKNFALLLIDIDNFKDINDTLGHTTGDTVLKELSYLIASMLRESDFILRYGGEEFLIIFNKAELENAYKIAERIRISVEKTLFTKNEMKITISGGLSTYQGGQLLTAIDRADELLYVAKNTGKNKIEK